MELPGEHDRLITIALRLAADAPYRRHPNSRSALVSWDHIEALRDELARLGFDWRPAQHEPFAQVAS